LRSHAQAQAGGLEVMMGFRLLPLIHLGFRQVIALCPLPARLASGVLGDTSGFTIGSGFLSNFSSITDTHFVAQPRMDRAIARVYPLEAG